MRGDPTRTKAVGPLSGSRAAGYNSANVRIGSWQIASSGLCSSNAILVKPRPAADPGSVGLRLDRTVAHRKGQIFTPGQTLLQQSGWRGEFNPASFAGGINIEMVCLN